MPFAAWDAENALVKLNPIADWSLEQLEAYVAANNVPVNPLHARGFPSIGCQPCTRAIKPGEDIRAGRWWWENEDGKECGLHNQAPPEGSRRMTAQLSHLDLLEAEAIHIFREAAAQFRKPVLMYSIGKDSTVLLHLARKAFWPQKPPFPLLAHRHDVEVPRHDRLPRQDGARLRPRPHRAHERGRPEARHQSVSTTRRPSTPT